MGVKNKVKKKGASPPPLAVISRSEMQHEGEKGGGGELHSEALLSTQELDEVMREVAKENADKESENDGHSEKESAIASEGIPTSGVGGAGKGNQVGRSRGEDSRIVCAENVMGNDRIYPRPAVCSEEVGGEISKSTLIIGRRRLKVQAGVLWRNNNLKLLRGLSWADMGDLQCSG